eukprot:759578-Hanusia_phi.AAC.1
MHGSPDPGLQRVDTRRAFEKKLNFSEEDILHTSQSQLKSRDKPESSTLDRRRWRGSASLFRFSYRSHTLNRTRRLILQGIKEKAVGQIPVFAGLGTFTIRSLSLTSLKGIGVHAEVKRIYMQNNLLTSFEGWEFQPSLEELHAEENFLESFRGACEQPKLESVWLQGNPIARCYCYRIMAICAFGKSLRYIDGQAVKKEEAEKAHALGVVAAEAIRDGWLVDTAPNPDAEFDLAFDEYEDFRKFAAPLVRWAASDGSDSEREAADASRQSMRSSSSRSQKLGAREGLHPRRYPPSERGGICEDQSASDDEPLQRDDLDGEKKRINVARLLQVLTTKSKTLEEQLEEQLKSQVETLGSIRRKQNQEQDHAGAGGLNEPEASMKEDGFSTPEKDKVPDVRSSSGEGGSSLKSKVEARRRQQASEGLTSMLKEWSSLKGSKSSLKSCLVVEKSPGVAGKDGRKQQRSRLSWSRSPPRQSEAVRSGTSWLEEEAETQLRRKIYSHGIAPRTSRGLKRTVMEMWSRVLLLKQEEEPTSRSRGRSVRTQQPAEVKASPPAPAHNEAHQNDDLRHGHSLEKVTHGSEKTVPEAEASPDKEEEVTKEREEEDDAKGSITAQEVQEPRREKSVQARRREIEERLRAKFDSNRKRGEQQKEEEEGEESSRARESSNDVDPRGLKNLDAARSYEEAADEFRSRHRDERGGEEDKLGKKRMTSAWNRKEELGKRMKKGPGEQGNWRRLS